MNNKTRNIVVTSVFAVFIAFFVIMCGVKFLDPNESSDAERRPLAQFPENITWEGIVDKSVIDDFEDYSVDQFPFREFFRGIKARFQFYALGLKENNGLAVEDGYIVKIEQDFDDKTVDYSIGRLEAYYNEFIKDNGGRHFLSLVPDKNYILGRDYGYPMPDYEGLEDKVTAALPGMQYIDIFDTLELEDYYRTDTHWSQDKLHDVVDKLAGEMGIADRLTGEYKENVIEGFEGVYYGQSALTPEPDKLVYLTSDVLDGCKVTYYPVNQEGNIYELDKATGRDGYEMFLGGVVPFIRIDNPASTSGKSLVIFRDSYGSSISPLLVEAYDTVYLIDIRSASIQNIKGWQMMRLINFKEADVLFIYSALVLNSISFK